ncbi:gliding motility protein GldM [Flavobacteriaceae bacterium LMO-SS05]|jgi:gliding motility-associated protein GldM
MGHAKLSARQKMINLMYLIFIAMLALNMSKEVLSAFGLMNEKLTESNEASTERNAAFMASLEQQAIDQPEKYKPLKAQADKISNLANEFNAYLTDLKARMNATVDDPQDYEIMDKGDFLDEHFFIGDKLKPEGEKFLEHINTFRDGVSEVLSESPQFANISEDVQRKFATEPVKNRDGQTIKWLDYHYKGYPLVASLTKMTQLQADIKTTESEVLSAMSRGVLAKEVSFTNYGTLLQTKKSAFFNGETFDGEIVLGRTDESTKPNKVELTLDGRALKDTEYTIEGGKVRLNVNAGSVGEHKIKGNLIFNENGDERKVPVEQTFMTVPKPNSATISADKMNVVYRGVTNPMTISFAGIPDNLVNASASGLSKGSGVGKYNMNPGSGREVVINVTGKLPDGSPVSDRATFRIKDIPKPSGTIAGQLDNAKLPKNTVEIATIGAILEDFDFELPIQVTSFKIKVPGQPSVEVNGTKLNDQAKSALRKARRGDGIQIFDIKAQIQNNAAYKLKGVSPVFVELTN